MRLALFGLILLAVGLTAPPVSAGAAPATAGHAFAGPARDRHTLAGARPVGGGTTFTSRNWDGYVSYARSAGATEFNSVHGRWVQPRVTCPKPNAWTVFWVGLDGWFDNTVEQGGSSAQCVNGTPQYTTWWEMFPTNAIQTVFTIAPGDTIDATVTFGPSTGVYTITVRDLTNGRSFTQTPTCASNLSCGRSSADWIAEDVGMFGGSGFFPLANYGTMRFSSSTATSIAGHRGSISDASWQNSPVLEQAGGVTYATVSSLDSTGQSFTATWVSSG
jgi:peptidase A4-like protein